MKKVNYKLGDIVELVDGVPYVYRGRNRKLRRYVYDPVLPNWFMPFLTFLAFSEEECVKYGYNIGAVPFYWKMNINVTVLKGV